MKTNFKRIGKQSISIVLAVMMMLSTMLVGMVTSNAAEEATATVYTTLDSISEFSSYINSDGSLKSGYTLKANTQYGGEGEGVNIWKQVDATKYTKKLTEKQYIQLLLDIIVIGADLILFNFKFITVQRKSKRNL